jgi:hypothetical protein
MDEIALLFEMQALYPALVRRQLFIGAFVQSSDGARSRGYSGKNKKAPEASPL